MKVADKLVARVKFDSPYIEDGKLEETDLIEVWELSEGGETRQNYLGIFKVKPEHFGISTKRTLDKKKTFYDYKLNEAGWEYLESNGLKHRGRGWVTFELIPKSRLEEKKNELWAQLSNITEELIKLDKL